MLVIAEQFFRAAQIDYGYRVHSAQDFQNPCFARLALSFGLLTASGLSVQSLLQRMHNGIAHALARALGEFAREGGGFGIVDVKRFGHGWLCTTSVPRSQSAAILSSVTLSLV
jgi:hypothetical protein